MSVVQTVECYVAYFHANNYEYINKLLPQRSQYYVIYFSLITMQRIYPGKVSYSCQIQVGCSSRLHSNTHAIRSPRVLTFKISFCAQRLITFQNVFDNVDIQLLCRQEILEIPCPLSTDKCPKNGAPEHYCPERNTAYHRVFKHNRLKFSSKLSMYSEN